MARPKKAPRDRLQITLPKTVAKPLRKCAKQLDRDLSDVISVAVTEWLTVRGWIPRQNPEPPFAGSEKESV